jgi:hypothetical protein
MNDEHGTMNDERKRTPRRRRQLLWLFLLCSSFIAQRSSLPALAGPTQEDVFKSINENVGASADGGKLLAFLAAGVGVAIILVLFNRRQTRAAAPQPLNHQGKLLREIIKTTGMRPEDGRRLKVLADQMGDAGTPLESPVTLLLCPSLLKKARERE